MAEIGDVLHIDALNYIGRALKCLGWRGSRAHSGVHEARKAMRHARACVALGFAGGKGPWRAVDRGIARTCRGLSELRDAHARVNTLDRLIADDASTGVRNDLKALRIRALAERSAHMRRAMLADPGLTLAQRELRLLVHTLDALPWLRVDAAAVERAMAITLRRARKARRAALAVDDADTWHRWRRRQRLLQHQRSVLDECGIEIADLPPRQRKLTQRLGELQDLTVLDRFVRNQADLPKAQRRRLIDWIRSVQASVQHSIREYPSKIVIPEPG